ncbi:MAG TPA: B12-binding domain-containing protein [Jatrophihabitans sp.]|jgi:DNA-binding transcriptional MerR regulator|uniref:MerR family transcriptional regulator n=1 Tax=Jatrophihabitans sp. TaxID=1932789 RepID=UPI002EF32669
MVAASGREQPRNEFPGVPIAEAARQLGVPMPTLRSWELRYNMPEVVRGVGKHRRYSAAELHGLRLMRDEIARGKRASLAAQSVRELLQLTGTASEFVADVLAASERSDPLAVRQHLTRAQGALGLGPCLDDVLLPAMQQIGLWWQTGRCDVEQEHLATEAARAWLEALTAYAPAPARPTTIVLACGPTDLHTIGLEALATLLRYQQWTVRLLGAKTAVPALETAIHATHAGAAVIVSHLSSGRARAIQSLHAANVLGVKVFYAGNAFTSPRSRRNLPGVYLGTRLQDACELIDRALG